MRISLTFPDLSLEAESAGLIEVCIGKKILGAVGPVFYPYFIRPLKFQVTFTTINQPSFCPR